MHVIGARDTKNEHFHFLKKPRKGQLGIRLGQDKWALSQGEFLYHPPKMYPHAFHKSGQFDAKVLVQNLFEVLTGHVLFIVCCHGWYLCNQTYKSLSSYSQMSRRNKKIENGNDSIRFISQNVNNERAFMVLRGSHKAFDCVLLQLSPHWQHWAPLGNNVAKMGHKQDHQ